MPGPRNRSKDCRTSIAPCMTRPLNANPDAVVEVCPCGTAYSAFNFPYMNQAPASDPESSWQVRLKGKSLKALMGPSAPFAGDHVELSDHHDDFASTVGVGGVISTKFTWPVDPKPKDSFLLTPEKEAKWRRWIALYQEKMLPLGRLSGRTLRHRLRQAGDACHRARRPLILCVLRRPLARRSGTARIAAGDTSGPRLFQ